MERIVCFLMGCYFTWGSFIIGGLFGSFAIIGPVGLALVFNNIWFGLLYLLSPLFMWCGNRILMS